MSKTPHCVCPSNFLAIDSTLIHPSNEMPSPPLPPRTLKANLSPIKNQWEKFPDTSTCNNDKVQCSCNRPQSCPADEGSPPIPPKCNAQAFNKSKYQINNRFGGTDLLLEDHKRKSELKTTHELHRSSRKPGRRNSSDGSKTRKKSRSKSRHLVPGEKLPIVRPSEDEQYFMKNHDMLIDKNSQLFYCSNKEFPEMNVNLKLSQITENIDVTRNFSPAQIHPPDLIPNRSESTKVTQPTVVSTGENSQKSSSKSRVKKFFNFLTKSKKTVQDSNRATTITPDATKSQQTPHIAARPRRSKSLHQIASLSPTTSMHANSNVVISPEIKTKSTSIFAVISPTTARLKRNLLCISPKATNNAAKKQAATLPLAGNSKSILSDNSQQRPGLSSLSGTRLSPVHLIASGTGKEQYCLDNIKSNTNNCKVSHFSWTKNGESCRGHKHRLDIQEKRNFTETDQMTKSSSVFKNHSHGHQDLSQRKTMTTVPVPGPSTTNNVMLINNPMNQTCSCYHYRPADNTNCPCHNTTSNNNNNNNNSNQAYHHHQHYSPSPQTLIPAPCHRCMHSIVQCAPSSHYHCCSTNQNIWRLVPCCPDQHTYCPCHQSSIYHHSTSPSANFQSSPPPPGPSFSNNRQFSRHYQHSYSKTPPPSFHTHQVPCYEDHCYEEYNLSQKMLVSQHQHSNCWPGCGVRRQCPCSCVQSKCSACGSVLYEEVGGSQAMHYNGVEMRAKHCSSTPLSDSVFEQSLIPKGRRFASPINADELPSCRCLYNHIGHRHSETCGRHSTEMRIHSCRNSAHKSYGVTDKERSSSKRRKNSSHSYHGSNLDSESAEDKHDVSRSTHHNAQASNMLPTTSMHLSSDINNITSMNCDTTMLSTNNNVNVGNNIIASMVPSNGISQTERKQHHFEPWRKTFHDNMMALRNLGWYWGPLNHLEAENLVQGRPDGTFLVRDSGNEAYFLSLTFRVLGTTYHTRIEYSQGKFSFWSQPESHSAITIVEFIDKAVAHSVSGKFHYFLQTNTPGQPPMEVSLLYPLSRYQIVQSLQHLSRFVILSNIRRDHVSHLDLPQSIKNYLMEKQYYIDCIETFVKITKDSEPLTYEPSGNVVRTL